MSDTTPEPTPPVEDAPRPSQSWRTARATLTRRDANGRPMAVYGIIGIGVATLLILMLIVYLANGNRDKENRPICTDLTADHAQSDIREGKVESFTLVYAEEVQTPTDRSWGPVQARLDYTDGSCGTLPQGITNQTGLMTVLGAIDFYNQVTDSARIKVNYSASANPDESLFALPTEVATTPPSPTPTDEPTATEASTTEPAGTPTAAPASPQAITPEPTATESATVTPTASPTP